MNIASERKVLSGAQTAADEVGKQKILSHFSLPTFFYCCRKYSLKVYKEVFVNILICSFFAQLGCFLPNLSNKAM